MAKRKHFLKILALLTVLVLAILPLAACGDAVEESNVITIGAIAPLSGGMSTYGRDMINAFRLAVADINADGGVLGRQLALIDEDDGGDPNTSTLAANRIISRGVDFVAGGYASGVTIPTMQLFTDAGLLFLIANANSTEITAQGLENCFMVNSPGTHQVLKLIDLLDYVGANSVALIHQGCAYTKNLADLCAEFLPGAGFDIATVQVMEPNTPDVSAIVTAIRNTDADFVYWCGYHADGSNVIKQLRRGGFEGHIAVGDGSASFDLIEACGPDGEGVFVTSPPYVGFSEDGADFIARYTEMFGRDPGTYATLSYDTIRLLAAAIEQAGTTDTAAVRNAVQNIDFQGLSGQIVFTADREPAISNFIILQISDGAFRKVDVGSTQAAEAPASGNPCEIECSRCTNNVNCHCHGHCDTEDCQCHTSH